MRTALVVAAITLVLFGALWLLGNQQKPSPPIPSDTAIAVIEESYPRDSRPESPQPVPSVDVTKSPRLSPQNEPRYRDDEAFQGLALNGDRGIRDLAAELAAAQAAINSGDGLANFDLARVIGNCLPAERLGLAADSLETSDSAEPSELLAMLDADAGTDGNRAELLTLLAECEAVVDAAPAGTDLETWQQQALEVAANAGNPIAALELALEHNPDVPYDEALALVNASLETDDYRAFFLAADFLGSYHDPAGDDINQPRALNWFYLGCARSPYCDADILERQLALDHTPAEIDAIRTFAQDTQQGINAGDGVDFEAGWLARELEVE
ncbi:MAG: hypothetical protein AAF662_09460 [Pseudomonadota bacterium]